MADVLPDDGADESSGALQPGTRLGRYELLVPIARGGMARVWAARLNGQRGFQKLVAIKTILPHLAEEPEFERMFLDEARIASGVHHANVCEIYELGEEKRTLYLAMEWVSGDSLSRLLRATGKTEALEPRVVARIIADACAGLHAAHELTDDDGRALGVVHRDLSPHNILLTADGNAKVADFGVAKALGQLHEATSAGQLKGKIAYMAPEQVTGDGVDRRSDIFSLGCVLYEATTGQRPFRGDGDHQVMHALLKGDYQPPSSLLRGYPPELEHIVQRALSPQPILRYPTAERMRFALEEFLARGQLVTQSNVAQVVRARIGELMDRRKERIRQASSTGDGDVGWSEPPGGMTPSNQEHAAHRSGVKQSSGLAARPPFPSHAYPAFGNDEKAVQAPPTSSTTLPHAPPAHVSRPQIHEPPRDVTAHTPSKSVEYSPGAAPGTPLPAPRPSASSAADLLRPPFSDPPRPLGPPPPFTFPPPAPPSLDALAPPSEQRVSPEAPGSAPGGGAGQFVLAIVVGVVLAAFIGVAGFLAWRGRHSQARLDDKAIHAGDARQTSASATGGKAASPAAASPEILFRVSPPDATLIVDGQELPARTRTVARPAMGKTVTVVVRAKGHEDAALLVDFFTASPLDVPLQRTAAGAVVEEPAPRPESPSKEPPPKRDPPRGDGARPRQPKVDQGLPANPY